MSFFKKVLSKVGIGAAKVDTILTNETFIPGEPVEGKIKIKGGSVKQEIDEIYFKVVSTYEDEIEVEDDEGEEESRDVTRKAVIEQFSISKGLTISEGEEREFPLSFKLPEDTPVTIGKTKVWVQTGLDIKKAMDPGDRDYINVSAHPLVEKCLDSVNELGFRLSEVVCEPAPKNFNMRVPFVQEYEFKPVSGEFKGQLDEIELVFKVFSDHVEMIMEVDRKARGLSGMFAEMMEMDESLVSFTFGEADLPDLTEKLRSVIKEYT